MNRELSFGRKDFLRYRIRIPLLHNMIWTSHTSYVGLGLLQRRYFL
nr:MAG TPA: hypothetical protein [Caudoviricetes sp.]